MEESFGIISERCRKLAVDSRATVQPGTKYKPMVTTRVVPLSRTMREKDS